MPLPVVSTLVVSVVCLGVLGTAFGLGLAAAAKRFRVDLDPRVEEALAALPNANCGSCGYAGCAAYAEAMAKGAPVDLCIPGGVACARMLAKIMGVEMGAGPEPRRAVVHCQGGWAEAKQQFEYHGVRDCHAAALVQGGPKLRKHGCLGFGTCAPVCPFEAIRMDANGLPEVLEERCTACGMCVKACPVGIISILPSKHRVFVGCSNPGQGKAVKEQCTVGCISCRLCVKAAASGAIQWGKGRPEIQYDKGDDFGAAIEKCPMHCFVVGASGPLAPSGTSGPLVPTAQPAAARA
jgi:RnfABCDGE-type electron transport complex B subunit